MLRSSRGVPRFIPARAGNTMGRTRRRRPRSVHPRSRGEHPASRAPGRSPTGSSPLARGTRDLAGRQEHRRRFIPARAGNTSQPAGRPSRNPVHPRSRGEHHQAPGQWRDVLGSSPLARGTLVATEGEAQVTRFIPARAGNTGRGRRAATHRSVHPRSRGEHLLTAAATAWLIGSSPLARGTLPPSHCLRGFGRFIPARAGNTDPDPERGWGFPVHPRSRGEHRQPERLAGAPIGSSPLARGTLALAVVLSAGQRFIPARAGNTSRPLRTRADPPVHPRSRGEHSCSFGGRANSTGSSPLARGTPAAHRADRAYLRFIPARAGNTARSASPRATGSVHPRSRGEHA